MKALNDCFSATCIRYLRLHELYQYYQGMKLFLATIFIFLFILPPVFGQQLADSLMPEAVITAYGVQSPNRNVPAAVSTLKGDDFSRTGEATPVLAFQQLPGVRLEERSPGSYRVSIRGSSLRSPFGVRNVKVYWNNLPITEANGNTSLNLLDVALYQQVEVIRGPAASYYGAGTGGVINIGSMPASETGRGAPEAEASAGSYGYYRLRAGYQKADSANRFRAGITHLQTNGYREHSSLQRQNAFWTSSFKVSKQREFQASVLLARLDYDIPGGLTEAQFQENPRQARPGTPFVKGSVEQNAAIKQQYALVGVGQHYQFTDKLENSTWFFGHAYFLENPFLTDFKRDLSTGIGSRSIWKYTQDWDAIKMDVQFGSEMLYGLEVARNYGNRAGQTDTLRFEDEIISRTGLYFLQTDFEFFERWSLTSGLSYNIYSYDINRLVDAELQRPYRFEKTFDPVWAPRLALGYQISNSLQAWGQVSWGFSPPSLDEIRTNEGSLNAGLEAEKGINYEVGVKGDSPNGFLAWSATAYYFSLRQTITSFIGPGSPVSRFRNAGTARQLGLETSLELRLIQQRDLLVTSRLSAAYQHYRFIDYQKVENDYSGNALPGVAPLTTALSFDVLFKRRLGLFLTHTFTDSTPLNDANSFYASSYNLLQARLEYQPKFLQQLPLRFFVSGQNLLNERYSLGYDLNAYGDRFFQTAAPRQIYAGIVLQP